MKKLITIDQWERKEHYNFFSDFQEPFFGVTVNMDCTIAFQKSKSEGRSFFLYYLYRALKAANEIENFRYRIVDGQVYLFDQVNASPTIDRPNRTFGFAYLDYVTKETVFYKKAKEEIEHVRHTTNLLPSTSGENVIHFSAIPWIDFSSISHARCYGRQDSCPKISFGKMTERADSRVMPVSIHVHHGLADAYHVGLFVYRFQKLLDEIWTQINRKEN